MEQTTRPILRLENLRKNFGGRRVLRDLSLSVSSGEVVAIVGANGSGKSTLLKIVAGLLRQTSGSVTVNGSTEAVERRRKVGYAAPDLMFTPELTAQENLRFFADVAAWQLTDNEITDRLRAVGLAGRENDPVSVYSSGMRQRLRLAFAEMAVTRASNGTDATPMLLLDEPSLALDADGIHLVAAMITAQTKRGGAVLLATNDAREAAAWGDRQFAMGT